jgi:hypothetical protein
MASRNRKRYVAAISSTALGKAAERSRSELQQERRRVMPALPAATPRVKRSTKRHQSRQNPEA